MATWRSSVGSNARNTTPMPPRPSSRSIRYLPSVVLGFSDTAKRRLARKYFWDPRLGRSASYASDRPRQCQAHPNVGALEFGRGKNLWSAPNHARGCEGIEAAGELVRMAGCCLRTGTPHPCRRPRGEPRSHRSESMTSAEPRHAFTSSRQIDQHHVRVLADSIEDNPCAVGRQIEAPNRESRFQLCQLTARAGDDVEQPEVLAAVIA